MSSGMLLYISCCLFCSAIVLCNASPKMCWSKWINTQTPDASNSWTDKEPVPAKSLYPQECQGKPASDIKIQCKDNLGEPFTGVADRNSSHYSLSCDMTKGLVCTPWPRFASQNVTCPDAELQIGCECPPGGAPAGATQAPAATTTAPPSGQTSKQGGGNGGSDVRVSLLGHVTLMVTAFVLLVA